MIKTFAFSALAAGAALIASPAMAQDSAVEGTWNTAIQIPGGATIESAWTFVHEGDGYLLEMEDLGEAPAGGAPDIATSDIVVEGNDFSFKQAVTTPQGAMEITIAGTVDGDALTAEAKTDFGAMPITGTRAE